MSRGPGVLNSWKVTGAERIMGEKSELHLPDLHISGFRGIDNLDIPRLGRVTLLVGKNGVGKTTVLDAVRVYAARGQVGSLAEVLERHDELVSSEARQGPAIVHDWKALFTGRMDRNEEGAIRIGPESQQLTIEPTNLNEEQTAQVYSQFGPVPTGMAAVRIRFAEHTQVVPLHYVSHKLIDVFPRLLGDLITWDTSSNGPLHVDKPPTPFIPLGPAPLANAEIETLWNHAVAEGSEKSAAEVLRVVFPGVDNVLVAGEPRIPMVKMQSMSRRAPLKSLGEGAVRLFGLGLALVRIENGFMLIDEAENGLHYSVHADLWRMVLRAAEANKVQVLATTHSFDCVRGFAQAAVQCEDVDGVLVRLTTHDGSLRAVEYSEKNLRVAAEQEIEVR